MMKTMIIVLILLAITVKSLKLKMGAYDDFVIEIDSDVPSDQCEIILENLETTLTTASQYLFSALSGRAYLRNITIVLPDKWPMTCFPSGPIRSFGEKPDLSITTNHKERIYTQQSLGCGQEGDGIYLSYHTLLQKNDDLARLFVREFAKYRYGVFDERGYENDPIHPTCYATDNLINSTRHTACSDLPLDGACTPNNTPIINPKARTSIMFAPTTPSISMFCDEGNHDKYAPTKHNLICTRRSVLDVILNHPDFSQSNIIYDDVTEIIDTNPHFIYTKHGIDRYIFVIENTQNMNVRESWLYLRLVMKYWALNIIPKLSEVGIIFADINANIVLNLTEIHSNLGFGTDRDKIYSTITYTPSDHIQTPCLICGLKTAIEMLITRSKTNGPASNRIVVIASGLNPNPEYDQIISRCNLEHIHISTITYPGIFANQTLNLLAEQTDGTTYTVFEQKSNVHDTYLTTYFDLQNAFYDIVRMTNRHGGFPVEIHRKEMRDDGRTSITGSFTLEPNMGEPAQFTFFTHNTVPLIKSLKLISPSHQVYMERNDRNIDVKLVNLIANLNESGTWTYMIETFSGNPQPNFIRVMATPLNQQYIQTRFWINPAKSGSAPIRLLGEVKYGDSPVLGAKIQIQVIKLELNGTSISRKYVIELLDTGSGDPDITKGDGIYTRYFWPDLGDGLYTFQAKFSDNGNTAYIWNEVRDGRGSFLDGSSAQIVTPFERIASNLTKYLKFHGNQSKIWGMIGDLKLHHLDRKIRLTWTSPDIGGEFVQTYQLKYAFKLEDILENFETQSLEWPEDIEIFPLATGSETSLTLDISSTFLDRPIYFALKAYSKNFMTHPSNAVRMLMISPPQTPSSEPTYPANNPWPNNFDHTDPDSGNPIMAKTINMGLELIVPITIGLILLLILIILYCWFCILKKQRVNLHKNTNNTKSHPDKLSSTVTIVPNTPPNTSGYDNMADPHQIGVPIEYEDEQKKRYSLVNQQEQQLIDELKQQQYRELPPYQGLSVISNNTLTRTQPVLSPYNSWSASQLLHEHERRHSPMEDEQTEDLLLRNGDGGLNGAPPVPPLPPAFNGAVGGGGGGYSSNYSIYGVHHQPIYQQTARTPSQSIYNPSLQGSLSSVNSGDKKRRNVTMV